jgi:osomolarity two-component system sensor histidine kinase TcsA
MAVKMGRVDTSNFQATQSRSWEDETPLDTSALLQVVAPQTHILLVEDNKINHTIMLKLLNSLGFEQLDAAWDGTEAVRMVKSKPLAYNLILMDINMPVMVGLTATEHIRKMNAAVPIIALTGNALKGDAETYLARGMSDSVAKPLHRQQLANVLWKWCGTQFSDYLPPESSSPVQSLGGYRQDHAGVETDRPRRKSRSLTYWPVRPVG